MDAVKVFHMTGGTGLTSYTENSSLQKKASDMVKHITLETVQEVYLRAKPKSLGIADLGCSSGLNTLSIIRDIIGSVHDASRRTMSRPPDSIHVYLNDLPQNDFNSIFKSLPDLSRHFPDNSMVFIGAYPGTFYHRLFPDNSIHFVYASYSLHWLSKVPRGVYDEQGKSINKDAIYITENSPKKVEEAYVKQFEEDFSMFLRLRAEEMVSEGRMVLIFSAREGRDHIDRGNSFLWEILWRSFAVLVSQGVVDQEKLDSFDVHYYAPCKEEIEELVKRDGCFKLDRFEMFALDIVEKGSLMTFGTRVAKTVRAVQESMISDHFGQDILDRLFEIYGRIIDLEMSIQEIRPVTFQIVLRKL